MAQRGQQQEIPKLVSVVSPLGARAGASLAGDPRLGKDSLMLNCYIDKTSTGFAAVKRPGTQLVATPVDPLVSTAIGQGLFRTKFNDFTIVSERLYTYRVPGAPSAAGVAIPLPATGFQPYNFVKDSELQGAYVKGTKGLWRVNSAATAITKVTDIDYPADTVPGIAYLEGTYYVLDAATGAVRGSVFQDGTSWEALNFIGDDGTYGAPMALNRHLSYIQAFYSDGVIFFYNAGNATGSPLSPVSNAIFRTGCLAGASVVELLDKTFFLSKGAGLTGNTISEFNGLSLNIVSTSAISRLLDYDNLVGLTAYGLQIAGNSFYVLNLPNSNKSLVYSLTTETWVIWTLFDPVANPAAPHRIFYSAAFVDATSTDPMLQGGDGKVYQMDTRDYLGTDANLNICFFLRTPTMDWGSLKRKFIPDLAVIGDSGPYSLSVRYSNDDYMTYSAYRSVDMSKERKLLSRCGSTRRRSWDLQYIGSSAVRIFGIEVMPAPGAEG